MSIVRRVDIPCRIGLHERVVFFDDPSQALSAFGLGGLVKQVEYFFEPVEVLLGLLLVV